MTIVRRIVSHALLLACAAACQSPPGGGAAGTERSARQRRLATDSALLANSDDTTYRRRLADLVRRSALVPIDSTARLIAALPRTPDAALHVVRQALGCQGMVLLHAHGAAAWQRAYDRATDSLVAAGIDYATQMQRMESADGPPLEFTGPGACGEDLSKPPVAESLAREPLPAALRR